ncbi:hypothetical protein AB1286_19030 [Trinickia sp. NRRL B-1857]|uniref:hypothetical protein n=1 Tax=Trinickia sp. NRRL B-1857 TaxID=3162879 RepID=UPI003D2982C6
MRATVEVTESRWYAPSPFGTERLRVPAFAINPEVTIAGKPAIDYQVTHTIQCADSLPALQEQTEAKLAFAPLPPFACITSADITRVLPRSRFQHATDGVDYFEYRGHLDDDIGTNLSFHFRAGAPCALSATIEQTQSAGLRFQRALEKLRRCVDKADRQFCAGHAPFGWGDGATIDAMDQHARQSCGTLNQLYLREPRSGEPPPPKSSSAFKRSPCD